MGGGHDVEASAYACKLRDQVDPPPASLFDARELGTWSFYRAVVAEFMATLLFLFVHVSTIITYKRSTNPKIKSADPDAACKGVGLLGIAWSTGGMIFILVYSTAGISGGHINPAVTFAMLLARKVSVPRAVAYTAAQCLGAICGVGIVWGFQNSYYVAMGGGVNALGAGYSPGAGLAAEIIGTFVLVYTVFSAIDPERNAHDAHVPVLAPLSIGFAVFMVHLATMPITGTSINPARSLGASVVLDNSNGWDDHWVFWVGPFIGAAIATIYHQYILKADAFFRNSSQV